MRVVRLAVAVLIAVAVAVLPITAGFAKASAASEAEMAMSAPEHDCPCCDPSQHNADDVCSLPCCCSAAILVEAQLPTGPLWRPHGAMSAVEPVPFAQPPDPPPPRPSHG